MPFQMSTSQQKYLSDSGVPAYDITKDPKNSEKYGFGNFLLGEDYDTWIDRMGIGQDEISRWISTLGRNVGTVQSQALNKVADTTYDLPEATQLAQERGVYQAGAEATAKGSEGIMDRAGNINRQAWATILSGDLSEEEMKARMEIAKMQMQMAQDMADTDFWNSAFSAIGGGLGSYAAAKGF